MNPAPAPAPPPVGSSQFNPSASPLHPPSVINNARVLSSLATVSRRAQDCHVVRDHTRATVRPCEAFSSGPKISYANTQLAACFSGLVAGILGLTNFSGFFLYLLTSVLSAATIAIPKCGLNVGKYVPQAHGAGAVPGQALGTSAGGAAGVSQWKGWMALLGIGQENILGFLLFWIGSYALIHGELSRYQVVISILIDSVRLSSTIPNKR
jgi:hypothetical protein